MARMVARGTDIRPGDTAGYHPASGDGSQGFGMENFKALFEAIERERAKRGSP